MGAPPADAAAFFVSAHTGYNSRIPRRGNPPIDNSIPVIVRMHVGCAGCGHTEDNTYEFDMPFAKSQPMEAYEPGKCPKCGATIQMHLKRTHQRQ